MSDKEEPVGFGTGFLFGCLFAATAYIAADWYSDRGGSSARYECRKKHNVFACEMVAVPVDPTVAQ